MSHGRKLAVIGLGYVGLPVAVAFARHGTPVIGFDIDEARISELKSGCDRTHEVEVDDLRHKALRLSSEPAELAAADFFIVAVPTPIDQARRPDLRALLAGLQHCRSRLSRPGTLLSSSPLYIPAQLKRTVCPPFSRHPACWLGEISPSAIRPSRSILATRRTNSRASRKWSAGQDSHTLDIIAKVYGSVVTAGLYRAPSIKVAEAAKVIENAQRDLNIAFMNELSAIFHILGIDTNDVLAAAGTKWNFLDFTPGLVGGHCIGVDPYYLTYRAQKAGYHPEVILAGRRINDTMGVRVARECIRRLLQTGTRPDLVTVLGLTFKENVADIRNSQVADIVRELQSFGMTVQVHDPLADPVAAAEQYGIDLRKDHELAPADAVVLAVAHESYRASGWPLIERLLKNGRGLVIDVKGALDPLAKPEDVRDLAALTFGIVEGSPAGRHLLHDIQLGTALGNFDVAVSHPECLKVAVERMHNCKARLVQSMPVTERFARRTVWHGVVHIFALSGHPTTTRAYAWLSSTEERNKRRFFAVLHELPMKSPLDAVRAAILQEHPTKEIEGKE